MQCNNIYIFVYRCRDEKAVTSYSVSVKKREPDEANDLSG